MEPVHHLTGADEPQPRPPDEDHRACLATAAYLEEQRTHLSAALASRDVIGQAKGLLMERYGLSQGAAFAALVRCSRTTNVPVHQIADELVRTRRLPGAHVPGRAPTG